MTAPLDLDAIEAEALGVSEELSARVEMKGPSLLSRFHPAERERAALFFRSARATTLRLVERIRELEASLARETMRAEAAEAIIAGRLSAPTDAEIAAHAMVDGRWLVGGREWHLFINDEGRLVLRRPGFVECVGTVARDRVDTHAGCRWIAIDINRPCAWPVVAETAK